MIRRVFAAIIFLPMLMLCSCNPGDVCGPDKIIDCSGACVDESVVNESLDDGTCDENLNCSEFNYDGGDCDNNETTTTTTAETTTTTTTGGGGIDLTMISIPGGTFDMGCSPGPNSCLFEEYPRHTVTISAFKMSAYEITQAQWEAVMSRTPSVFDECGSNCPVETVSWDDVQNFIEELNNKTGKQYRLPTEAEWEYAARAGTTTPWYCGDDERCLDDIAWYWDNSGSTTHPVGQKQPNAWGLYDMTGNVYEWCSDRYDQDYYTVSPSTDPQGPDDSLKFRQRVYRGGSWGNYADDTVSSYRGHGHPNFDWYTIGFRLCLPQQAIRDPVEQAVDTESGRRGTTD